MSNNDKDATWLDGAGLLALQSQIHAGLREIRCDKVCEPLLVDSRFDQWHCGTGPRELVLLGGMGCGKTVTMSFLIDALRRPNQHQWLQPTVCHHYCRSDGTNDASVILFSLVSSLLAQHPTRQEHFSDFYHHQVLTTGIDPRSSVKKLEEWLQPTLTSHDSSVIFAVDGLQECDREVRRRLLRSLADLLRATPILKVLLSSTPEEEILHQLGDMNNTLDLIPNPVHDRLIVEKMAETWLSHLPEGAKGLVVGMASQYAQGSALWARLAIQLIDVRRIHVLGPLWDFFEMNPVPDALWHVYARHFSRYTKDDAENARLASEALGFLAVGRRPLSILELAWAAALATSPRGVPDIQILGTELVNHRRLLGLIQPFIAPVDFNDLAKRQVRFVHWSIRSWVIAEWGNGASKHRQAALSSQAEGIEILEARTRDTCIRYLLLWDIGELDLFSEHHLALDQLPQDTGLFSDDNPPDEYDAQCSWETWEQDMIRYDPVERGFGEFFVYAACHWLDHFGAVTTESLLADPGHIRRLCQPGSRRLHNWITQYCRPACTIKPRFTFDSSLYDSLSITALYGPEAMLRRLADDSDLDNRDWFLPESAMEAADQILQHGDLSRLRVLWMSKAGPQIQNREFLRRVANEWAKRLPRRAPSAWHVVFDLLDGGFETMVGNEMGNEAVAQVVEE